jgi:hypothetical protein
MAKKAKAEPPARSGSRRRIPNPATVVDEFLLELPGGHVHRVLRTTQRDEYEETRPRKRTKR